MSQILLSLLGRQLSLSLKFNKMKRHEILVVDYQELSIEFVLTGVYTPPVKKTNGIKVTTTKSKFENVEVFLDNEFGQDRSEITNILNDKFLDEIIEMGRKELDIHIN